MMHVSLKLPDGRCYDCDALTTGSDVVSFFFPELKKDAVAYVLDEVIHDLSSAVTQSGAFEIITRQDKRALALIRHSAAHVLAEAVQALWPETQVTLGPVIENGFYYDFARDEPFTPEDFLKIEQMMHTIIARDEVFTHEVWEREKLRALFLQKNEPWKVEIIDSIPEGNDLKIYRQGSWFDLCRGSHVFSTGQIGTAFKLMKVAGAYWRGDSKNRMLTRIYGTAWADNAQLENYLHNLEEAIKRDHRRLGRDMDLFHFQDDAPGVIFWHPKGWRMFQQLVSYMRRRLEPDYQEVNAPEILDKSLWEDSGHWTWYRENMFQVTVADSERDDPRVFVLKPMNCPGHVQIFKNCLKSYRDLPVRFSEFGKVHRYEPSGALHGLMRVRGFTQDDAHIFCTEEQMAEECLKINELVLSVYRDFGFKDILIKLSTRPEKRVGSNESWDRAEKIMSDVLKIIEKESDGFLTTEVMPGEGAFYGPKFEYTLKDALGRHWQCGTIQVDFNLPERFSASYIDSHSQKKQPVMIHRAICGSMERFLGILIEHFSGNFPVWLASTQVVVATLTSDSEDYVCSVAQKLRSLGLQVETDLRNEKLSYKIREHSVLKVPFILVCGNREVQDKTVSVRRLGSQEQKIMPLEDALSFLKMQALPPDALRFQTPEKIQ